MKRFMKQMIGILAFVPTLGACKNAHQLTNSSHSPSAVKAKDILSDNSDFGKFQIGGTEIIGRKGTVAAAVINASIIGSPNACLKEKELAMSWLQENATLLAAIFKGELVFSNQEVQAVINEAAAKYQK